MENSTAPNKSTGNLPCIWMLSGVINYRLCHCHYDCEHCDLYRVLSGQAGELGESGHPPRPHSVERTFGAAGPCVEEDPRVTEQVAQLLSGCRLFLDRPYRPPHFWLQWEALAPSGEVTVGIDAALLRLLQPIQRVVTPGPGIHLERDQPCGWIAREHMAVPLRMPVAGTVTEVNEAAQEGLPGATEPNEASWLLRLSPSEDPNSVDGLVSGESTLSWYAWRIRVVKEFLRDAVAVGPALGLGVLMEDGGPLHPCLEDVLGSTAFEELIARIDDPGPF